MNTEFSKTEINAYPNISVHDCRIDKIVPSADGIHFYFSDGFILCEPKTDPCRVCRTSSSIITVNNCASDDVFCKINHRFILFGVSMALSRDISFKKLSGMLSQGLKIELIDEFYTYNQLYWRGEIYPYKKRRLGDEIEIRINGEFTRTYKWNQ